MDQNITSKVNELIHALGELGLAQERHPESSEIPVLMRRAEELRLSVASSLSAG